MFLIVSDRRTFVETWKTIFRPAPGNKSTVQTRSSLSEALAIAENIRLTLTVVDGSQLGKNTLQSNGELARLAKLTRLLLVESNLGPDAELAALALGIAGCCPAQLSETELQKIVDVVIKGGIWISRSALPDLLSHLRRVTTPAEESNAKNKLGNLTPREREIALCVAEGATNKLIAKRLNVSDVTIKTHLTAIFHKLGISGRVNLALMLSGNAQAATTPQEKII